MSHAQVGQLLAGERLAFENTLLEKRKRGSDPIQQGASGGGEGDGPWWPIEELESKLAFEPGDLLAQRGLRDVQPFRRPREVQLVRKREKRRQQPEVDSGVRAPGHALSVRSQFVQLHIGRADDPTGCRYLATDSVVRQLQH